MKVKKWMWLFLFFATGALIATFWVVVRKNVETEDISKTSGAEKGALSNEASPPPIDSVSPRARPPSPDSGSRGLPSMRRDRGIAPPVEQRRQENSHPAPSPGGGYPNYDSSAPPPPPQYFPEPNPAVPPDPNNYDPQADAPPPDYEEPGYDPGNPPPFEGDIPPPPEPGDYGGDGY